MLAVDHLASHSSAKPPAFERGFGPSCMWFFVVSLYWPAWSNHCLILWLAVMLLCFTDLMTTTMWIMKQDWLSNGTDLKFLLNLILFYIANKTIKTFKIRHLLILQKAIVLLWKKQFHLFQKCYFSLRFLLICNDVEAQRHLIKIKSING